MWALFILFSTLALVEPLPARARNLWQIGLGVSAGYNSQVFQPLKDGPSFSALTLSVSPWLVLGTETGRISELIRYQLYLDGIFPVTGPADPAFSYQNFFDSQTRLDLTARLTFTLGVQATQGKINSFAQTQNPSTEAIQGINQTVTDFISVGASSLMLWEPSARIKVTQPIHFRTFIPYGQDDSTPNGQAGFTQSSQSYTLDAGVGIDRLWARTSLGSELLIGWFLPQRGAPDPTGAPAPDRSVVTAQLIVRGTAELAPRWHLEGHAGVFVATQASHFLQGDLPPIPPNLPGDMPTVLSATLVSPIGGAELRYQFPGAIEAGLGLSYLHSATGEVFLGGLTVSDAATLRGFIPLPRRVLLAASGGYRHSNLAQSGGFGGLSSAGNSEYHLFQGDAAVTFAAKDWMIFSVRYSYLYQYVPPADVGAPGTLQLASFDRHLAIVGVAFTYPSVVR